MKNENNGRDPKILEKLPNFKNLIKGAFLKF